jgi:hypothetical protein
VAADWEAEVVPVRAQLQRDHATLEGARSWQSQAEEKAKEAEELKASLADKAAAVVAAEEQLRQERAARQETEGQLQQERAARQEAEGQLQQEQAALVEAWVALERERLAREKALGQLQQERAVLEGARAYLKEREDEVSRLDGEMIALSISLEEQGATVVSLQQAVEGGRQALEAEKKQVEGKSPFCSLFCRYSLRGFAPILIFSCSWPPVPRTALGHATTQDETVRAAYNSSEQELGELRAAALETCHAVEEGEAQAGSSLASRLRALDGHVSRRMRRALHLAVKALGVVGSHYQVDFEAVASGYVVPIGVEDEVAMERADALAAATVGTVAEDFMDFLFPDAPDAGEPQA